MAADPDSTTPPPDFPDVQRHGLSSRAELVVRDGAGRLVYRLHLPVDPIADAAYLAALVAGERVSQIACERPGEARIFYAERLPALRAWADGVRRDRLKS